MYAGTVASALRKAFGDQRAVSWLHDYMYLETLHCKLFKASWLK